jgi:DNA repair exonuclease SbcCD ATPase subunit
VKHIVFNSIKIQNFLSVGSHPLTFNFAQGITLITGENRDKGGRNGVGKSSVVESLYWCLFGSTMRDIKREKVIHQQTDDSCIVSLSFDIISFQKRDEYVLTRTINPNKVHLTCNDTDITRSSMPKTDELIKELVGATEEVFQNAVIMSANNTLPFMAQKKVDKRKFVEGILHLGIFGEMLLQIRQDFNDGKKKNEIISTKFSDNQRNLEVYKKQSEKFRSNQDTKVKNLSEKIGELTDSIKELNDQNNDTGSIQSTKEKLQNLISKKEDKLKQLTDLSTECINESQTIESKIQNLLSSIKFNTQERDKLKQITKICPVCKQDIKSVDEVHISSLITEVESNIQVDEELLKFARKDKKKQETNCETIKNTCNLLITDIRKHEKELASLGLISQQIIQHESRIEEIKKEIVNTQNEVDQFISLIENTEIDIKTQENELENIQKHLTVLETAKYIVSEEGVKTYIVKKMLNVLNNRLNFYLQALEAPCRCEFNEMFEETIHNDLGNECSYFNFSGGERKRIDLAILFMFQDLLRMQTGTSFSISMYDELFDSALDEKGVEKILNILKERVDRYKENVYIISHNKAAIKSGIDQVIYLEKSNGATRIVEQII